VEVNVDVLDLAILRAVQQEFPLVPRPYETLAGALGVSAREVFGRVSALRRLGVIRRIGPLFQSRKLGFRSSLVAARVSPDAVEPLSQLLDRRDEVTHNYLRDGRFNVWFTVLTAEGDDPERLLDEVRALAGVAEVRSFATRKVFKLDASFDVPAELGAPAPLGRREDAHG
jgi:DNA-binding Lrp family transcriptional regulator